VIEKARATPFTAEGAKDAEKKLIGKAKAHRGDAEKTFVAADLRG
jgi:hypothetical protein